MEAVPSAPGAQDGAGGPRDRGGLALYARAMSRPEDREPDRGPDRPIELLPVRALDPPRPDDVVVSFSVSPAGEALVAWASPADHARLHARDARRGSSFARTRVDPPGAALRVTIDGVEGGREVVELTGVTTCFPTVHRLPGDRLLVLGGRAAYRSGDPDHNAIVFGADGRRARSGCVGDGVTAASVTAAGAIWIGYFDEGVFGNLGWGDGPASQPIGAPGWNRFDAELARTWSHPEEGEIADCYALTTTGEECLICPYTEWPILRVSAGDRLERWSNSIHGAHAMLAFGPQLALVGGYSDERDRVVTGTLQRRGGLQLSPARGQLLLGGAPWAARTRLTGRDGVLHTFFENQWYAVELAQLVETLR